MEHLNNFLKYNLSIGKQSNDIPVNGLLAPKVTTMACLQLIGSGIIYNIVPMQPQHCKFNPSINQTKQFPLYFTYPLTDTISKTLTAFGSVQQERIVYMGPRHTSSIKLLKAYSVESRPHSEVVDSEIYGEDEISKYPFDSSEKEKYYPPRPSEYRLFVGVNPTAKKNELRFDSNFESGNLDLAVSLGGNQYDLYMRVDSNTKGHTCWFFFKASNYLDRQKVKFNIVNFSRSELLYDCGMKPYVYCSSTKEWVQEGQNIEFYPTRRAKYIDCSDLDEGNQLHTLSFQYQLKIEDEFVYFAYCIPYSYSYLLYTIGEMEKKHFKILDIDRNNLSTGGLVLPIITITNKNSNIINIQHQKWVKKDVVFVIGRLHPGQTQSSWILHGLLNYLCSPKAKQLRNRVVFKIIPMVNVDGVVAGNFRTGLLGRDLNRSFNHPQLLIEIGLIRSIANMFKPFMFLDFHGHSSKKNIFAYGPDYSIDNKYFLPSRLLCKQLSKNATAFRYYGCSFKLSGYKKNTGRGVMLKQQGVSYSFTIETSAFAYGPKREQVIFDRYEFIESGSLICMGLDKFIKIINILPKRLELERELQLQRADKKTRSTKRISFQGEESILSVEDKKIIEEVLSDEKDPLKFDKERNGGQDSDFQENNDYTQKQLMSMLTNPSETPIFQNKKTNKNTNTNKKLLAASIKQSRKIKSLSTQKELKLSIGPKMTEPEEDARPNRIRLNLKKKIVQLPPSLQRTGSQSLKMNVQYFPQPEQPNINKIRIKQAKKIFSDDSYMILEDPVTKLKSLNQVSLDYSLRRGRGEYQPLSEAKKLKEKQEGLIKKRNRVKQKIPYNLNLQVPRQKREGVVEIKYSVLPMLGRSGNMDKQQSSSLMSQILQNHQRSVSRRLGKQAKMAYY